MPKQVMTDEQANNPMSFDLFVEAYYQQFIDVINRFDKSALADVHQIFTEVAAANGTIWIAGNGGSASIADHAVCDATKSTYVDDKPPFKAISLTSNNAMLTALANDLSFDEVFSKQLEFYLGADDALLLVSSSGDSANVVKACEYANAQGVPTIAFTGFSGGRLKQIARIAIWIPVDNYGMTEDIHQSLMHVITQYIVSMSKSR